MAYVQPTGNIQLMKGVNLDNRYMHTLYFANTSAQTAYFSSLVTNTFNNQMYTKVNKNSVRIRVNAEDINDVTYMRFNNYNRPQGDYPHNTSKYYYAFVLAINYINENVTEVIYEIDVMQTWFIQAGSLPNKVYVQRQHVNPSDDIFGKYLEPEPFGSEIYDFDYLEDVGQDGSALSTPNTVRDFTGYSLILNTSAQPDATQIIKDGIVNGTKYLAFDPYQSAVSIITNMENLLGSWDKQEQSAEIVDMFMFPKYFAGAMNDFGEYYEDAQPHSSSTYFIKHPKKYDNYTPQNKKLFGYPFAFLYATTKDGDNAEYRWEYFDGDVTATNVPLQFDVNACASGGGSIEMHPRAYNGIDENFDAKLSITNFPKCAWAYDAYEAFVASGGQTKALYTAELVEKKGMNAKRQNFMSNAPKALLEGIAGVGAATVATGGAGAVAGALIAGGGMASGAHITSMGLKDEAIEYQMDEAKHKVVYQFADAYYEPNMVVGSQTPNLAVGAGFLGFAFYHCHVRDDEMVKIDNFLSMYGYAINNVVTPHLHNRKYWNFIQTKDVVVLGNMPNTSKSAIAKILDGGIFFWNSANVTNADIGNFNVGNNMNNHGQIVNKT